MNELKIFNHIKGMIDSSAPNNVLFKKVSTDSRSITKGDIFFGFKGVNFDGNDFAQEALFKGASLVVVDNEKVYNSISGNKILVKNSLEALKYFGRKKLESYKGTIICITGSSGKTTTKKLVSLIFSIKYRVFEAYKNFNNEIGVAINAANLDMESDFGIFEIGSNNYGEIALLSDYLKPHISIITNIGSSHIGHFGSIAKIAEEKLSMINNTKIACYIHEDCKKYINDGYKSIPKIFFGTTESSDIKVKNILRDNKLNFTINYRNNTGSFQLNHFYDHFVINASAAIGVAIAQKIKTADIQKGLDKFSPEQHRGEIVKVGDLTIIDDTYNASFDSIISAIKNLAHFKSDEKYAVLGEMGEIEGFERELYSQITNFASNMKDVIFIFFGSNYEKYNEFSTGKVFTDESDLKKRLILIKTGTILFKASRSKGFERYIDFLKGANLAL